MRRALVIAVALAALLVGTASASAAERRSAGRLAAGLRDAQPVQGRSRRSRRVARRRSYYDQLDRPQAERPGDRLPHRARQGRRRLARRQDDHVPPAHGHPLVGRQAVHERRRALDVQRRAAEQDEPAARRRSRRVKSVSAPDANTFVLHLSTRDSEFLDKLAIPILPAHIWSKYPDREARQDRRARSRP